MVETPPNQELAVAFRSPYWLRITVASSAARTWLERQAPRFGELEQVPHTEHAYNLFVHASHDPQDVARYLATQAWAAEAATAC